ncbi:MAG: response regulator [Cocleimonas sp.]|nr:response regulator [Cocleimonas sp.]
MNNSHNNSIGIHFAGLEAKERAIFDRIIAFNTTHGLVSHSCEDIQSANLIISAEEHFSQFENELKNQKTLILSNDPLCALGDTQIKRPILITRVMKALEATVDLVKLEKTTNEAYGIDATNEETIPEKTTTKEEVSTETEDITTTHSGHHALIIDDSAAIRKQLELELRDAGITADFAESGEEALEKIEDTQYDLVFLDIIMPGIDGYETCRSMRTKASYKRTPIIMLSGKTSPLDEVQGVIAGATTYLTKPVKSAMLQETLTRVTKWLNNFATTESKHSATV